MSTFHRTEEPTMHPTVMSMIADERALDLRCAAVTHRRSRLSRPRAGRLLRLRIGRRATRIAHA
jgi:hypothetical protein